LALGAEAAENGPVIGISRVSTGSAELGYRGNTTTTTNKKKKKKKEEEEEEGKPRTPSGWWLTYPSEKYEFVSWDDEIPNIWKNMFPTTNQP